MVCNCSTARNAPQSPADKPVKHTGFRAKLSGNFNMSMKYFKIPGTPPLYSGVIYCMKTGTFQYRVGEGRETRGFSA
jgi:hypothetical protein